MFWPAVIAAIVVAALSAIRLGRRMPVAIEYIFLLRYPLLIATVILIAPLIESRWAPTLFELTGADAFSAALYMSFAAWACVLSAIVILDAAPRRFSMPRVRWPAPLYRLRALTAPAMLLPLSARLLFANSSRVTTAAAIIA